MLVAGQGLAMGAAPILPRPVARAAEPRHEGGTRNPPSGSALPLPRILRLAAAQMGPNQRADSREAILARMTALLEGAAREGARLVVFPELAFTTFFPRWLLEGAELDQYYESGMPNPQVQPLFDRARALGIGFYVGYAERTPEGRRFNTAVYVHPSGEVVLKYRKVHLPGHAEYDPTRTVQHLEKRYFEVAISASRWSAPRSARRRSISA